MVGLAAEGLGAAGLRLDGRLDPEVMRPLDIEVLDLRGDGVGDAETRLRVACANSRPPFRVRNMKRIDGVPDRVMLEPPAVRPEAEADHIRDTFRGPAPTGRGTASCGAPTAVGGLALECIPVIGAQRGRDIDEEHGSR